MPKTLWILTEERPKKEVVGEIINKFLHDQHISAFIDSLRIIPILDKSSLFTSFYRIVGLTSPAIENVYLRVISGTSSFVDYLVYYQDQPPVPQDRPLYAIEETKTDDMESRNTGIYQRASKFVYLEFFYPGLDMTMLYNLQVPQKAKPTQTNIFGTRCYRTLGVRFMGKTESESSLAGWQSIEELIDYKTRMKPPPAGNVPIRIEKVDDDLVTISGRLIKAGRLNHDPNIGGLSMISATLRKLGWTGRIQITNHGLSQGMVRPGNKFVRIAKLLDVELEGLTLPDVELPTEYWRYESTGEKLVTIFIHIVVDEFSKGFSIYENHASSERGYFYTSEGKPLAVSKKLSAEDGILVVGSKKVQIPDLILLDPERLEIVNIEGEQSVNVLAGIRQLNTFDNMEKFYLTRYYPNFQVLSSVVLYGGEKEKIEHIEVSLLLNSRGKIALGVEAPNLFKESIKNLVDFWASSQVQPAKLL